MSSTTKENALPGVWEQLKLKDDFMFAKVMRNQSLCRQLLELILRFPVRGIVYPEEEKAINLSADGRSVRLDVYTSDEEKRVYDVEMQVTDTKELPRRSRYYQGMMDLNLIEKGEPYRNLNDSYVIFICTFDLFGTGDAVYRFENCCPGRSKVRLNDGAYKVFVNANAKTAVRADLKAFFDYLNGKGPSDSFTKALEREVDKVRKNQEWRREFMTLLMRDQENVERGEEKKLIKQVCKKLCRGKAPEVIAEELEEDISEILRICQAVDECGTDSGCDEIYDKMWEIYWQNYSR